MSNGVVEMYSLSVRENEHMQQIAAVPRLALATVFCRASMRCVLLPVAVVPILAAGLLLGPCRAILPSSTGWVLSHETAPSLRSRRGPAFLRTPSHSSRHRRPPPAGTPGPRGGAFGDGPSAYRNPSGTRRITHARSASRERRSTGRNGDGTREGDPQRRRYGTIGAPLPRRCDDGSTRLLI